MRVPKGETAAPHAAFVLNPVTCAMIRPKCTLHKPISDCWHQESSWQRAGQIGAGQAKVAV